MDTITKIKELNKDDQFVSKMKSAQSANEAVEVLAEYDIQMSENEFVENCKQAMNFVDENGELTAEGLDIVAGGLNVPVSFAGIGMGALGLAMMMSGPVGWGTAAVWLGGCAIGYTGICMR